MKLSNYISLLVISTLVCLLSANVVFAQDDVDEKFDTLVVMQKNGYNKFFYKNGLISSEGGLKNGKPDGYWKNYYETGKLKSEGNRKGFLLDSVWKFYNPKGFVVSEIAFKKGIKNGIVKAYYDSAKLKIEEYFKEGKKQGLTIFYHPNGGITNEIPFINGLEDGIAKEYDSKGIVTEVTYYKEGYILKQNDVNRSDGRGYKQGIWLAFYDSSQQIRWEGFYKNNKKHGTFREFSKEGNTIKVEEYVNGELVEFATTSNGKKVSVEIRKQYYPNAMDHIVGTYKDNEPDGVFREYDMQGNVIASTVYNNGIVLRKGILDEFGYEQGFWQNLFESGKVRSEGQYNNGKKVGPWRFYHEDGKLMQEGSFKEDKAFGLWRWYYEDGIVQREEYYKNGLEDGDVKDYLDSSKQIVTAMGSYSAGKRDGDWMYNLGQIKVTGKYSDDGEEGEWKELYPDGGIRFEGKYHNGVENGNHKYYYANGVIREERFYRNGDREKTWKFYNQTGELITTVDFKNDLEVKVNGKKLDEDKLKKRAKLVKKPKHALENPVSKE